MGLAPALLTYSGLVDYSARPVIARAVLRLRCGGATPSQTTNDHWPRRLELSIDGVTCAACVPRVEIALLAVPGVSSASVSGRAPPRALHA